MDLGEGEATLGRSRGCTVTLRDPSASRNHVLVTVKPGEVRARDMQSSNGTYLNGERLTTERLLHDGDRITIGETDIFVRIGAPAMEEVGATVRLDAARMECPACGAELPLHAELCARCGHRMGAAAPPAGEAVAQPAAFGPAPPPPPASAPALPPPYVPPPVAPPPPPQRTELSDAPPVMQFAPPPSPAREPADVATGELLPRIGDEVFHSPGPPPLAEGWPEGPSSHRSALAPTPPPFALADVPLPRPPGPPVAAAAPAAGAAPAGALRPAGFWIRVAASLIDAIWMSAVVFAMTLPFGGLRSPTGGMVYALLSLLLGIVVPVLGWAIFGATPGKALLGLRVIGGKRRRGLGLGLAFLRLCGVMVSAALFGLGFLMVAFTRDKRGLHDHLAGTAVVRR